MNIQSTLLLVLGNNVGEEVSMCTLACLDYVPVLCSVSTSSGCLLLLNIEFVLYSVIQLKLLPFLILPGTLRVLPLKIMLLVVRKMCAAGHFFKMLENDSYQNIILLCQLPVAQHSVCHSNVNVNTYQPGSVFLK